MNKLSPDIQAHFKRVLVEQLKGCVLMIDSGQTRLAQRYGQEIFSHVTHDGKQYVNFHLSRIASPMLERVLNTDMVHEACAEVNKYQLKYDGQSCWFHYQLIG